MAEQSEAIMKKYHCIAGRCHSRPVPNLELGADTDSRTQVWRDFIYNTHRWKLDTRGTRMVRGTRARVSEIGEYNKGSRGLETKGNMTVRSFLPHITIKYLFQTDSNEDTGQSQGPHPFVGPVWRPHIEELKATPHMTHKGVLLFPRSKGWVRCILSQDSLHTGVWKHCGADCQSQAWNIQQ